VRIRIEGTDLKGPYIQGPPGGRFIYLNWGTIDEPGTFALFRRAKLQLDAVPPEVLKSAAEQGVLVGRLGLTDRTGNPLCASVRPPLIEWSARSTVAPLAGCKRCGPMPCDRQTETHQSALFRMAAARMEVMSAEVTGTG
jgi:Family of unknown function (DUF5990)